MTEAAPTFRVMTWNIHGAIGRNPGFDMSRVIHLIKKHSPDIIAVQEIDSRRPRSLGAPNPFEALRTALGTHGVDAKSVTTADGEYGQALISRWPIRNVEIYDISYAEREPRRAIRCDLAIPDLSTPIRVIATHLGLSIRERRDQTRALLNLIGKLPNSTIVLGDFNDWFWIGSVRKALAATLPGRTRQRSFPSFCPVFRFDRIYCRPAAAIMRTYTDQAARSLSDHLPVIAEMRLDLLVPAAQ